MELEYLGLVCLNLFLLSSLCSKTALYFIFMENVPSPCDHKKLVTLFIFSKTGLWITPTYSPERHICGSVSALIEV